MQICRICGETYEADKKVCPYCGCQSGYPEIEKDFAVGLPEERYAPIMIKDLEGRPLTWVYQDKEMNRRVMVRTIPTGEKGEYILKQLENAGKVNGRGFYPEILEIKHPEGMTPGYYICEDIEGETISSLIAKENPLPRELSVPIIQGLLNLCITMREQEVVHGDISMGGVSVCQDHVILTDFGDNGFVEDDDKRIDRIAYRLFQGRLAVSEEELEKGHEWATEVRFKAQPEINRDLSSTRPDDKKWIVTIIVIIAIAIVLGVLFIVPKI